MSDRGSFQISCYKKGEIMQELFCRILQMSVTGLCCVCLVLPIRLPLIKCGRKYACYLWLAVFINLLIPFSFHGKFSLIPGRAAAFSVEMDAETGSLAPAPAADRLPATTQPGTFENIDQQTTYTPPKNRKIPGRALLIVWLLGLSAIVLWNAAHLLSFRRRLAKKHWVAWDAGQRIAEIEGLPAPFLWGIFRPVIFLPAGLAEEEKALITLHESCHRKRCDSAKKLAASAAVALHWFNPAVWAAWALFNRDMEIACDEAVLRNAGRNIRRQYAQTLLRYAAIQNGFFVTPPAFGEPSAKTRIKNILYFRKQGRLHRLAGGIATVLAVSGMLIHPLTSQATPVPPGQETPAPAETEALPSESEKSPDTAPASQDESGGESTTNSDPNAAPPADREADQNPDTSPLPGASRHAGYVPVAVTHIPDSLYFTPGLRSEEELDAFAQQALRELYDLTGYQPEDCVYSCSDLGTFFFAKTESDLRHSRDFYCRSFGEKEGYGCLPGMDIVSARRFWFSDVQQLSLPNHIEEIPDGELAVWFLQHSGIWQGEDIVSTELSDELESTVKAIAADGSFYEITLDLPIQAVSRIYGPYPKGHSH